MIAVGVMPQGTFNYFARTHAIPTDPTEAVQALLGAEPVGVQVGLINDRLQLEQVGLPQAPALDEGCIAAVMLRPIGALAMLGLMLRGSLGTLGEADTVESFKFHRMLVKPRRPWGRRWRRPGDGRTHPSALCHGIARSGATDVGGAGGYRRVVAGA